MREEKQAREHKAVSAGLWNSTEDNPGDVL